MSVILPLTKNPHPRTDDYSPTPLPQGYLTANGMIVIRLCKWRSYSVKEMRWWEACFVKTGATVSTTPMWCESRELLVSLLENPRVIADKFIQVAQRTHQTACGTFEIQRNYFTRMWTCKLDVKEIMSEGAATAAYTRPAWKDLEDWVARHRISEPRQTRREVIENLQQAIAWEDPAPILCKLQDEYFAAHKKQRKPRR